MSEKHDKGVVIALAGLTVLLLVFQYITLAKFIVLPPGVTFWEFGIFVDVVMRQVPVDWSDGLLAALIFVPVVYLIITERQSGRVTSFLRWVFANENRTRVTLLVASLISVRYYAAPGSVSWAGDAPQHLSYLDITRAILSNFELPIWTNYYGAGSPFLQFYGLVYFLLGGAIHVILGDVNLTTKLVLGTSHAVSGMGVYCFCRVLLGSRRAAFLAGLGYVLCFWHAQQVLLMGRHPVGLVYALLPWPFYYFERSLRSGFWLERTAKGAAVHAVLVLTHPGYGMYATVFLGLYVCVRSLDRASRVIFSRGAILVGLGLFLSSPHTIPMMVERSWTRLSLGWSLASDVGPTLYHLLNWSNFKFWLVPIPIEFQHWYGGYLGLSLVVLSLLGLCLCLRGIRRAVRSRHLAILVCTCLAYALPFVSASPLVRDLPLIPDFSAGRYLLFTVFFLCVSAAIGVRLLAVGRFSARQPSRTTWMLGLLLFDLGLTTFQQPFRPPLPPPVSVSSTLRDGQIPDFRNFFILRGRNPYNEMSRSQMILRTPSTMAPHPGDLLTQTFFVEPLEESFRQVLPDSMQDVDWNQLSRFVTGFRLLNVKTAHLDPPHLAEMDWRSPILVSGRSVVLPSGERLVQGARHDGTETKSTIC